MMKSMLDQGSRTAKAAEHIFVGITSNIPSAYVSRIKTLSLIYRSHGYLPHSWLKQIFELCQSEGEVGVLRGLRDLHICLGTCLV